MKKLGFTLAEIVVTLAVVGTVAALTLPMLKDAVPNEEMLMFKKAYYLTERIVSDLVNDEDLYPERGGDNADYYLSNVKKVKYKGHEYGDDDSTTSTSAKSKFCKLFVEKLNRASDVNCTASASFDGTPTVVSSDGMIWKLPMTTFSNNPPTAQIYVDVNGSKGPNCQYNSVYTNRCPKPDRFIIAVSADGKIRAVGAPALEYLKTSNFRKK